MYWMSRTITTLVLIADMAGSTAAGGPVGAQFVEQTPTMQAASHAVRGTVKSISATSLVITSSRRKGGELTFVLNSSTLREGTIAAGVTVSVRYRTDGNTLLATAVTTRVHTRDLPSEFQPE